MNTVITIGRQFGSGGKEVGIRVAKELGIPFYDKELLREAARKSGLCEKIVENFDERPILEIRLVRNREYPLRRLHRYLPIFPFRISHSAICTAFRAAPFLIWSLTHQNVSELGSVRSLRMRPT